MSETCYWIATDLNPTEWDHDITKPPPACPWPQQCVPPEHEATQIGETAENECQEGPTASSP